MISNQLAIRTWKWLQVTALAFVASAGLGHGIVSASVARPTLTPVGFSMDAALSQALAGTKSVTPQPLATEIDAAPVGAAEARWLADLISGKVLPEAQPLAWRSLIGEAPVAARKPATVEQRAQVLDAFGRSPLHFEPNQGQAAQGVQFLARAPGYQLYLLPDAAVLALHGKNQPASLVRMQLVGDTVNSQPVIEGLAALPGRSHYYLGNDPQQWRANVPNFAQVRYRQVYPGVDWVLYGNPRQLEYDFVVAPGVDPAVINVRLTGADRVRLAEDGHLVAAVAGREALHSSPTIYQEVNGERRLVEGRYVLRESAENAPVVGFEIAAYDRNLPLVIDPVVYFTFVGGKADDNTLAGGDDYGYGIAVDSAGYAYITGSTSTNNAKIEDPTKQFPVTGPGLAIESSSFRGGTDVFVTRMDSAGTIIYSTYFGGSSFEAGYRIAVDSVGNAYITGYTNSNDFPITINDNIIKSEADSADGKSGEVEVNPTDPLPNGVPGALYNYEFTATPPPPECSPTPCDNPSYNWELVVYNKDKDSQCFTEGEDEDKKFGELPKGLELNANKLSGKPTFNDIGKWQFIIKATDSQDSEKFACQTFTLHIEHKLQGTQDAFVSKINASGTLGYSLYLGGAGNEAGNGIAVDGVDQAYVTGYTTSDSFPAAEADISTVAVKEDAFFVQVAADGQRLKYSQLTGFPGNDRGQGIVLDSAGTSAYITGFRTGDIGEAAFVAKVDDTGAIQYPTTLDGPSHERGLAIDRDDVTGVYITGYTSSPSGIATADAYDETFNGPAASQDAFVAKYTDSGTAFTLNYATYLGGSSNDVGYGIAVDSAGNAYVAGETYSPDFPMIGADDDTLVKGEAFLARLNPDGKQLTYSSFWGGAENDSGQGLAKDFANDMYMVGYTNSPLLDANGNPAYSLGSITPYRDHSGGADAFVAKFSIPVTVGFDYALSVTVKSATGSSGTVGSVPTGVNCSDASGSEACREVYSSDTAVTLTATAGANSAFVGWADACASAGTAATCAVTMNEAKNVAAYFAPKLSLTVIKAGTGGGTVTSNPAGIDCGADCSESYLLNTIVSLTATPAEGSTFTGWSGSGCSGTGVCQVTVNEAKAVTATFELQQVGGNTLTVAKNGTGDGTVTSNPAGIDCGADCSESYPPNTSVSLTATPNAGSSFVSWSGACSGTGACTVTMDAAKSVTATFSSTTTVLPDLIIETVVSPGTGTNSGRSVNFALTVKNQGAAAASGFKVGLYLSTDPTLTPNADISTGYECTFIGGLVAGATASCSGNLVLPQENLAATSYYLGAYADPQNAIAESNDTNNGKATTNTLPIVLLTVNKGGAGKGAVTSSPTGIACGVTCTTASAGFLPGDTKAILSAVPATGSTFTGWSGAGCSGAGTCEVTMSQSRTVTATFSSGSVNPPPAATFSRVLSGDYNNDNRADIVWHHAATGQVYGMLVDGFTIPQQGFFYQEANIAWQIVNNGDLDGNGNDDLIWWNNQTGQVWWMPMNGLQIAGGALLYQEPNTAWQIAAAGDLDGDGKADLIWWNNQTGQVYGMLMSGATIAAQGMIYQEPNTNWRILAARDITGDGKADLLWRNQTTGEIYLMPMSGLSIIGGAMVYQEPNLAWDIAAVSDLNGDGMADLTWWNSQTGQVYGMLMNSATIAAQGMMYQEPDVAWTMVASGDYNGDGKADLLWRNSNTGLVYEMPMNGLAVAGGQPIYQEASANWRIVANADAASSLPQQPTRRLAGAASAHVGPLAGELINPDAPRLDGIPVNAYQPFAGAPLTGGSLPKAH